MAKPDFLHVAKTSVDREKKIGIGVLWEFLGERACTLVKKKKKKPEKR